MSNTLSSRSDTIPTGAVKDPDDWKTGDETMTEAQGSCLQSLCGVARGDFGPTPTRAEAWNRIDRSQEKTSRSIDH
jgi:hypothetical protein